MKITVKRPWYHDNTAETHPTVESFVETRLAEVDYDGGQLEYIQQRAQETATLLAFLIDKCVEAKIVTPEELVKRFGYDLVRTKNT